MSTNYEHNGEDDTLAARRTAHALGQTSGDDWAAVEAEMAASPQARHEVAAVAALARRLKEAAETTPPAIRSSSLREAVEARLTELESAARPAVRGPVPQWRRRVVAWVLTAGCLAGIAVALLRQTNFFGQRGPRQVAQTAATPEVAAPNKNLNDAAKMVQRGSVPSTKEAQQKLAELVDQFNRLNEEQRYKEAEVIAKRAKELAPHELVANVMVNMSKIRLNPSRDGSVRGRKEETHAQEMSEVDESAGPAPELDVDPSTRLPGSIQFGNGNTNATILAGTLGTGSTAITEAWPSDPNRTPDVVRSGGGLLAGGMSHFVDGPAAGGAMVVTTSSFGFVPSGGWSAQGVPVYGEAAIHDSRQAGASYSLNGAAKQGGIDDRNKTLPAAAMLAQYYDNSGRNPSVPPVSVTFPNNSSYTASAADTFTGGTAINGGILQSGATNVSGGTISLNSSAASSTFSGTMAGGPGQAVAKSGGSYLYLGYPAGVARSTTLPNGTTTQTVIAGNVAPGFNFNDASNPLGEPALAQGKPGEVGGKGLVKPVQIETLPGLEAMVIKANPGDVAAVEQFIKRVDSLKSEDGKASKDDPKPAWLGTSGEKPAEVIARHSSEITARNADASPMTKEDLDRAEKALTASMHEMREKMKRELEQAGANDDRTASAVDGRTASLRGQNAVGVAGEYRRELEKMQEDLLHVRRQMRSGSPSTEEEKRIDGVLASVTKQAADLGKEIAGVEAIRSAPKKPLETWKPARVVPNASRLMVGEKEELPLKGMQVDVRVDGFRARVLLDLYYFNDRPQQLEGNFQLRLPDEAAPYFFAFGKTVCQAPQVAANDSMFFKPHDVLRGDTTPEKILALRGDSWEQPKVARMVPKEKAAMAYRDTVRRRIDPALVEWSGAGVFQCRVFPLAAQSLHRITIGYDVDLVRVGDDLELRLDLPEWQSGDVAPATVVDLNVAAADARQVSLGQKSEGGSQKAEVGNMTEDAAFTRSPSPDGRGERFAYRLVDPKQRPLTVRLRKPGTLMLTGNDEATGNYFATRVTLPLGEQGAGSRERGAEEKGRKGEGEKGSLAMAERSKQAVFLVDTSLSAGPQFPLWTKMLRATLMNNRDQIKQFAVLFFNVETFWWQEKYVENTPENVDAVLKYADNLALEGATDLGRALREAAAPSWRKAGDGVAPDLFLLSDGAATWGEDRWGLLAATLTGKLKAGQTTLTPSPSPKGRGEPSSALFGYRTGLAGGDSRLLGYLAERTGGAVFSLVGEAEIASASIAHRNRPWKLTNLEMAGTHDLLVAGRPQYVFPGQQLTIVGRLESPLGGSSLRSTPPYISFTLQQGSDTQTIKVAMEQVIPSELAGRTFGQVATNQLEDVSGVEQTAEPVATAYARHFRITGRTCSLLMLESEQDYARFNIKPEEDDFVVKQQPADPIVSKAIANTIAAMSDPKANFLAWYNRLAASEVRFDLPASLKMYIDSLPVETFAVVPKPLVCKLRRRGDLSENLRRPRTLSDLVSNTEWHPGTADYDAVDAEAQRRLADYGADDALRCLSSLVEERPGDAALARDLAFTAIDWQRPGEAYHLLRRSAAARTFEPITSHAMAHCLEQMGRTDLAIIYYELACGGQWDPRFGDMHNIALLDYARFLRRVAATKTVAADYAQSRLNSLAAMNLRDTADVAALIFWNTDGTDVDLHVVEPSGEECFYQHTQTASGGHISRDVTTGYGPELYLLPKAPSGRYEISAHYFATDVNRASTRTKVLAFIYENWGAKDEHLAIKSLALSGQKEKHELGVVKR